jgi:YVTN family beta-propeller protein
LTKIKMPGQGPRGVSIAPNGLKVAVGAYYAGQVYMIDTAANAVTQTISLGTQPAEDSVRRGDRTYHDASTTLQKWLSCATCHPDARADGLNWDMPNDGIGNAKNTKTHLYAFDTPPAMWRGVRQDASVGVTAGFKYIKFKNPTQQEVDDVSAYMKSLTDEVSPYRKADGSMTADAIAGKAIFESSATQCTACHTGKYLTDLAVHDVGTKDQWDIDGNYYTPPLTELWRTAPYMHDGSAAAIRDVLTTKNAGDKHGHTSQLTSTQIDQLTAYLLQVQSTSNSQPITYGDLNSDGNVDAIDAALFKKVLLGVAPENVNLSAADVNVDGQVDAVDYAILRKYLLGAIISLPVS